MLSGQEGLRQNQENRKSQKLPGRIICRQREAVFGDTENQQEGLVRIKDELWGQQPPHAYHPWRRRLA